MHFSETNPDIMVNHKDSQMETAEIHNVLVWAIYDLHGQKILVKLWIDSSCWGTGYIRVHCFEQVSSKTRLVVSGYTIIQSSSSVITQVIREGISVRCLIKFGSVLIWRLPLAFIYTLFSGIHTKGLLVAYFLFLLSLNLAWLNANMSLYPYQP